MRRILLVIALGAGACGSERDFAPCDIRAPECQADLLEGLRKLRNPSAVAPNVVVRTEEEVIAESVSETTPEQRTAFARRNATLALLRLSTPALTLDARTRNTIAQTAAFYSSASDRITVIDRGKPLNDIGATLTFTHELVHAMQSAEGLLTLARGEGGSFDWELAHRAVTEGEATLYEDLAGLDLFGWDDDQYAEALAHYQGYQQWRARESDHLVYDASFLFAYAYGARFMYDIWRERGFAGVVDTYHALPATTYEVMNRRAPEVSLGADAIAVPTADYDVVVADSFGAFMVESWCRHVSDTYCGGALGDGFTGLISKDGTRVVAIWRIRASPGFLEDTIRAAGLDYARLDRDNATDFIIVASNTGEAIGYETVVTGWRALTD